MQLFKRSESLYNILPSNLVKNERNWLFGGPFFFLYIYLIPVATSISYRIHYYTDSGWRVLAFDKTKFRLFWQLTLFYSKRKSLTKVAIQKKSPLDNVNLENLNEPLCSLNPRDSIDVTLVFSLFLLSTFRPLINTFQANVLFLCPLKTSVCWRYQGGIEMEHWPDMGQAFLLRF